MNLQPNSSNQNVNRLQILVPYNPGDLLYKKGINHKEQHKLKIENEKVKQNLEQSQHTFKPFISERSQVLAESRRSQRYLYPEQNLIAQGRIMEEKKELKRNLYMQIEQSNCSFKPAINPMQSLGILQIQVLKKSWNKRSNVIHPTEIFLINSSKSPIKSKLNEISSSKAINSKNSIDDSVTHNLPTSSRQKSVPFLERMTISINERQAKLQQNIQPQEISINDPETGQELFRPQICRAPMIQRNQENLPIGEYLYQMRHSKEAKQNNLMIQHMQEIQNSRTKSTKKSSEIYEQVKLRALEEIFQTMDSDQDGLISAHQVEISGFSCEVLSILAPLLCEMEQINAELNLEQFIDSANRLLQTLTVADRDRLFTGCRRKMPKENSECTFQPELNKKSRKLAETLRPKSACQNRTVDKISEMKLRKEKQELEQCTFKPQLYKPFNLYAFTKSKASSQYIE